MVAAAMWALSHCCPLVTVIPGRWRYLGWCVVALGLIPPVAAFMQFRIARTTVKPHLPEKATTLVTWGVYSWTRNPMYLGLSVLLVGWAILLGALSPFLGPLLFVPIIQRVQILPEEHALRQKFGEEYDGYCRRVNRWLGRGRHV